MLSAGVRSVKATANGATLAATKATAATATQARNFSAYQGQYVEDKDLVKKNDDWVIEETNFCLGM